MLVYPRADQLRFELCLCRCLGAGYARRLDVSHSETGIVQLSGVCYHVSTVGHGDLLNYRRLDYV